MNLVESKLFLMLLLDLLYKLGLTMQNFGTLFGPILEKVRIRTKVRNLDSSNHFEVNSMVMGITMGSTFYICNIFGTCNLVNT